MCRSGYEVARSVLILLRSAADTGSANWGASLLGQLVYKEEVDLVTAEPYIQACEAHTLESVRCAAAQIRECITQLPGDAPA